MLVVVAMVASTMITWALPANACIPDDPNCVRRVICIAGEAVNGVTYKLGYGEPIPCD
jgi:hypothetical protein